MQTISTTKQQHTANHLNPNNKEPNTLSRQNKTKEIESPAVLAKRQLNTAILQSNIKASINAGNQPITLLFMTAIDGINDVLKDELGENSIQNAYDSGLDISPEATANRIISMSTAFFSQYQDKNPNISDKEAAKSFVSIIESGIKKGFEEAKEILDGLNVLEGAIGSNIEETFDLVQKGLISFTESFSVDE